MTDWTPEQIAAVEEQYGIKVGSLVVWNEKGLSGGQRRTITNRQQDHGPATVEKITPWQDSTPSVTIRFASGREDVSFIDCVEPYRKPYDGAG